MPDEPTIPNATCPPFAGASARDLLAGILLASGGSATEIPNTTQCREWGYGRYTERDLLAAILLAIESGGGGGGPFLPLAGGAMDENAIVTLDNNSQWRQSTPDIGIAGSEGFSIVCGVGYEYKFASGYLFVLNNTSTQVRQVLYAPVIPSVNDDITLGYVVGTTWETADGIKYICTDNTDGAAGWDLVPVVGVSAADDVTASETLAVNTRGIVDVSGATAVVLTLPTGAANDVIERRIQIAAGSSLNLTIVSGATTLFSYTADGDEAVGWFQFTKHSSGWKATGLNLIGVNTTGGGGLPASVTFAFDARLLTYPDGTEIDDVNVWDASVGTQIASQSDLTRTPYVVINSSEDGTHRTVRFDATSGEEDVLDIAPGATLSGEFSLFFKIKVAVDGGILAGNNPPTAFIQAIAVEGSGMKMLFGSGGTLVESTEAPTLNDSAFHILEVHRNSSDLVEWFVDDVAYGTATNSESPAFNGLCNSVDGNLECVVFCDTRVSAGDRTDILNYLA